MTREAAYHILQQPDDRTCGPTCLHSVYHHYGDEVPLDEVINGIIPLETGGTLAVHLACHALRRGYRATIYTYNLHMFDLTWFGEAEEDTDLEARLIQQLEHKPDPKLRIATEAYLEFLSLGGEVRFALVAPALLKRYLRRGQPILTGVSATYLYGCAREVERGDRLQYDDLEGVPQGHFVVLYGWDEVRRLVRVADPLHDNPAFQSPFYETKIFRVIGAMLLGVLTYDANLLIIEPTPPTDQK